MFQKISSGVIDVSTITTTVSTHKGSRRTPRRLQLTLLIGIFILPCHAFQAPPLPRAPSTRLCATHPNLLRRSVILSPLFTATPPAEASLLDVWKTERRQLELCLTSVLRVRYWALTLAGTLQRKLDEGADAMEPYLEARLGAKALLTGRVGGGANLNVMRLASVEIRECLRDAKARCAESRKICEYRRAEEAAEEMIETLAALVEFDGLDNTQDPSPRSTLFRTMYNKDKATFVKRLLLERLAPTCNTFILSFGGKETERNIQKLTATIYPHEIPPAQDLPPSTYTTNSN